MKTIRISDEVWEEIAKRGKFGETEDNVLRRVFGLDKREPVSRVIGHTRRHFATVRMTARAVGRELQVEFESGARNKWVLPDRSDKVAIRSVRDAAVEFASQNGATPGQVNAVKKALTEAGYHLAKF